MVRAHPSPPADWTQGQLPGEITMKLTREHRKAINAYARKLCWLDRCEVGERCCIEASWGGATGDKRKPFGTSCKRHRDTITANEQLFGGHETDLWESLPLATYKTEIEPDAQGRVLIDLYVYEVTRLSSWGRETQLWTNITARFVDGKLIDVFEPVTSSQARPWPEASHGAL